MILTWPISLKQLKEKSYLGPLSVLMLCPDELVMLAINRSGLWSQELLTELLGPLILKKKQKTHDHIKKKNKPQPKVRNITELPNKHKH